MTFADLFINEPPQWGLRGDSYLWNELKADLSIYPLPADNSELKEILAREFLKRTGPIAAKSGCISSKRLLISQLYQRYS